MREQLEMPQAEVVTAPAVPLHCSGDGVGIAFPNTYADTVQNAPDLLDMARRGNRDAQARLNAYVLLTNIMVEAKL